MKIKATLETILLTILALTITIYSFKLSSDIYYTYELRDIRYNQVEILEDKSITLYIDKEVNLKQEYINEVEEIYKTIPTTVMETIPNKLHIIDEDNYNKIFGTESAGVTYGGNNIAISGAIFTRSDTRPTYYLNFLKEVIHHESGHIFISSKSNLIQYLTNLLIPYPGSITHHDSYAKATEWEGPKYFNTIYPLTIETSKQSTYGKTNISEDYAESIRYILGGQSHLISENRTEYVVQDINVDIEDVNRNIFPFPTFTPNTITEIAPYESGIEREYTASYVYTLSEEVINRYLDNLEQTLKSRSFTITFKNERYIKAQTDREIYYIQIPNELERSNPKEVTMKIYAGPNRTKLINNLIENEL